MNFGAPELAIVFLVVLVLFGGAKLPQLARSLGQAQGEFRNAMRDGSAAPAGEARAADGGDTAA